MTKYDAVKQVINDGCSVEIGQLCICNLQHFYHYHVMEKKYQVHCEHSHALTKEGFPFSEVYENIDEAVKQFLLFKEVLYEGRR